MLKSLFGTSEVFADCAAGAPIDPRVREVMLPWLDASWNPSAIHPKGVMVRKEVDMVRASVAKFLYAHADEITFTSSGTEALHLALHSALSAQSAGNLPHVILSPIEHHALLEPVRALEREGKIALSFLTLRADGTIDPSSLAPLIRPSTVLVAVMYANNEIGTIQPIREIAKIIRDHRKESKGRSPYFLVDACQAFLSLECHVERLGVDYLVLNAAKVSGPQGTALLYGRRGVPMRPMFLGGGQEEGKRAGTEFVAGVVGLGKALDIASAERSAYERHVGRMRDDLEQRILRTFPDAHVNGTAQRLPGHLSVTFPGADHQYLALALGEAKIMVGTKSACRENEDGDSHVLVELRKAGGDAPTLPPQAIRFSLGKHIVPRDIGRIMSALIGAVPLARKSRSVSV